MMLVLVFMSDMRRDDRDDRLYVIDICEVRHALWRPLSAEIWTTNENLDGI